MAMFQPQAPRYSGGEGFFMLESGDGESVSAYFAESPRARDTVFYFHGNAEDIGDIMPLLSTYRLRGYNVFCVDYRGYGLSAGEPTEANVYEDALAGLIFLTETKGIPVDSIILHGRSLGGGPATELALHHNVGGLILESTFRSIYKLYFPVRWVPGDKFCNEGKLGRVQCPVLVVHGKEDQVVPVSHGETLADELPESQMETFWVEGAGHNDLVNRAGMSYWNRVDRFIRSTH